MNQIKVLIFILFLFCQFPYSFAQGNASYNFMQFLKAKYNNDNPNWGGLVGMIPLWMWADSSNTDKVFNLWRVPIDKNNPTFLLNKNIEFLVSGAESSVYLSTLWFNPGNDTEEGLKRAIIRLNRKSYDLKRPIKVRIVTSLYKNFPSVEPRVSEKILKYLLPEQASPYFDLSVIVFRNPIAFNHTKILAVDSDTLITGGINFSDKDYEDIDNPVNDLSIQINFPHAADLGRIYLSKLAYETEVGDEFTLNSIACTNNDLMPCKASTRWLEYADPSLYMFKIPEIFEYSQNEYVLGAGKFMENKEYNDANFSTYAILSLLESAQYEINISQQSIMGIPVGNKDIQYDSCNSIGRALMRGVKVNIILSSYQKFIKPDLGYAENATSDEAMQKCIVSFTKKISGVDPTPALQNLSIYRVARWFNEYPNYTPYPYGSAKNHVKLILVDNLLAYVGSENLYYNMHTEYGVFVHSQGFIKKLRREYLDPTLSKSYYSYQYQK